MEKKKKNFKEKSGEKQILYVAQRLNLKHKKKENSWKIRFKPGTIRLRVHRNKRGILKKKNI